MSGELDVFLIFGFFIVLLFICGIYCILVTRNLLRALLGIEILMKAVTLLMIVVGYITNQTALVQSLVITIIVIEVALVVVIGGIGLRVFRHTDSLDMKYLRNLKG